MLNKRGQEGFLHEIVQELAIGVMIGFAMIIFANHVVNPYSVNKELLANDLGLLIPLVEASPYPYYILYHPFSLKDYIFELKDNELSVKHTAKDKYASIHYILRDKNIFRNNIKITGGEELYLVNTRNKFNITTVKPKLRVLNTCPEPKSFSSVFIDPAHGEEQDKGFSFYDGKREFRESKIACLIADSILPLNKKVLSSRTVEDGTINCNGLRKDDIINEWGNADIYLGIYVGNYTSTKNIIKAYVEYNDNYTEAYAVACRILSSLSKLNAETVIIPVEGKLMKDKFEFLNEFNGPSIVIEFGSLQSLKTRKMLENNISFIGSQIRGVLDG